MIIEIGSLGLASILYRRHQGRIRIMHPFDLDLMERETILAPNTDPHRIPLHISVPALPTV